MPCGVLSSIDCSVSLRRILIQLYNSPGTTSQILELGIMWLIKRLQLYTRHIVLRTVNWKNIIDKISQKHREKSERHSYYRGLYGRSLSATARSGFRLQDLYLPIFVGIHPPESLVLIGFDADLN